MKARGVLLVSRILVKDIKKGLRMGCEDGWRGVRARAALSLSRRAGAPRPRDLHGAPHSSATLSPGAAMPASSREKSPRVSRVLSMISSDAKKSHGEAKETKVVEAEGDGESPAPATFTKTPRSPRIKKSKRGILPYFRELVTKDTDVLDVLLSKEPSESECGVDVDVSKSITDSVSAPVEESEKCETDSESDKCDPADLVDLKTYSLIHSRMAKYESPLKKTQIYQKSFLHNRYGSTPSVETLPGRAGAGASSSSSASPVPSAPSLAALRSRTLEPVSRSSQDPLGRATLSSLAKSSTLDTVKARFHNHVNNLTYEGMNFTSGEPSNIASSSNSSSWSLGGRGFSSPFSKFSAYSTENLKAIGKDKDKKHTKNTLSHEPKAVAKSGVKKILLHSRLKDDTATDTSPDRKVKATGSLPGTTTTVEPVSRNLDSITIISNKNVTAKLNITVVKTPETVRRGSFRFTRTGGFRSSLRASQRRRRELRSPLSSTSSSLSTSSSSLPTSSTTTTTTTTAEGKPIPEYAKVNKRKNSKPDIVEEENFSRLSPSLPHAHESPAEKAPVVKKIEAAAYKARKDSDPSLKVNPVKKSESFKAGVRVGRRSSLTYASRAKMMKETLEGESFVKTQAVKLRRKDSKNGRLDMKNARKAEYRLSVTIKPSTVATLANKFNTIISQNQAGAPAVKSELPLGHVSVQKARMQRSPQTSIRLKNRVKATRAEPEAKDLPEGAKNAARSSRSPSPKKSTQAKSPASLLEKLGDNKTDEEKVCEKIKTALSSGKFKGETDDSEDEAAEKKSTDEEKCRSRLPSPSPSTSNASGLRNATQPSTEQPATSAADSASVSGALTQTSSTIPKTKNSSEKTERDAVTDVLGQIPQQPSDILTEIDQVFPLPERHAKSDSMDSGISTEGDRLSGAGSPNLPSTSLASTSTPCLLSSGVEDSSLETVISTDTFRSEDSAVVVKNSAEATQEPGPSSAAQITTAEQEKSQGTAAASKGEEEESKDGAEPLEKGIIDGLETEGKPGNEQADAEGGKGSPEEDAEDKNIEADLRSIASSNMDDTHSEVSSVCSEAKSKRSTSRGHESRIYTAVKTAVKNTVKKTKEKDAERKEERERERRNRSPSADREKWYRRGRSREQTSREEPGT
ncbi:serine-rich adhesin for platelets-like [Penaeus monodon]|uniref:serine-rich adhesin for platelets-like n=1 Tax=Penaeus monodon TaxID=6687 RepID=UPI0018A7528E|nr:serine-rich adhesin for platelets-like [Penaeus monodon]